VPVVCSNTSSLPEVSGDAGLMFNPLEVEAIADVIGHVLVDPEEQANLRQRGLERASQFTWDRVAAETWQVYRTMTGRNDAR
jgi:glycosyltransferase involved in cell wall biosynthesis